MRKFLYSILAVCLLALTFSVVPAAAADQGYKVYLQLDGIPGESINKRYDKWIDLTSVNFQISGKPASTGSGSGGVSPGKANFDTFAFTKNFDSSSIPLMLSEFKGSHIPKGKIVFTRPAGKEQEAEFLTFEFDSIVVSNYSFNDTKESIAITFEKIKWTYWPIDSRGIPSKTPIQGGWDIKQDAKT